ncbi:MAG TPA: hypothetical protein VK673_21815 [Chthoniobacterales bacterium]|nr:hypothetical protein [Chthoniobacterales bacterium]
MNVGKNSTIRDTILVDWIVKQWTSAKNEYKDALKSKKDDANVQREQLLLALAKILRTYINSVRSKRGDVQREFKEQAHGMTEYLQKQLLKADWSNSNQFILQSVQYARKHTGNVGLEGRALARPVSATDRKKRASLERKAASRLRDSLAAIDTEAISDDDNGYGSDLLSDKAELD